MKPDFSKLEWSGPGEFQAGSVKFKAQSFSADLESASDGFVVYKEPKHFDAYSVFWPADFSPYEILELGIWAGGSAVLWNELLRPKCLSALDIKPAESIGPVNLSRLRDYQQMHPELHLHWRTSQDDVPALRQIMQHDFPSGLDLVIDDASHMYGFSRRSFEIIFPHVRHGGWYVIEDWSWDVVDPFPGQQSFLRSGPPLSQLIRELVLIAGTEKNLIERVQIIGTVAFFQRGSGTLPRDFAVPDLIPAPTVRDLARVARRIVRARVVRR